MALKGLAIAARGLAFAAVFVSALDAAVAGPWWSVAAGAMTGVCFAGLSVWMRRTSPANSPTGAEPDDARPAGGDQ